MHGPLPRDPGARHAREANPRARRGDRALVRRPVAELLEALRIAPRRWSWAGVLAFTALYSLLVIDSVWGSLLGGDGSSLEAKETVVAIEIALVGIRDWVLYLALNFASSIGIALTNESVVVCSGARARGRAVRRAMAWTELRNPVMAGLVGRAVLLDTDGRLVNLTGGQARVVLTEARCPLHDQLPVEVVRHLGLSAPSARV